MLRWGGGLGTSHAFGRRPHTVLSVRDERNHMTC